MSRDEANENAAFSTRWDEARRTVAARLREDARAYSADGQTFGFLAPIASAIPVGGYVELRTADGTGYLGQVTAKAIVERDGPELTIAGDGGLTAGLPGVEVARTAFRVRLQRVSGGGVLLGRVSTHAVAPLTANDVFEEATIGPAAAGTVDRYLQARGTGRVVLDIGTLPFGQDAVRATLLATGFDRHTFLCGQSGSGKTYALGVILERLLLETELRLLIIDPNADFVHLGGTRPFARATAGFGPSLGETDYAALCERYRAATVGLRVCRPARHGTTPHDALRTRFSDFAPAVQGMVLRLDPVAEREEFNAFGTIVARFGDRPYSLADLRAAAAADLSEAARRVALRIANLGVADWDVWAEATEPGFAGWADPWRAIVFDIGGFGQAAEKSLVALGVLNAVWQRREERQPVLVVIDEAHNVCPHEPADPLQAAATERAIQIAGEGRKFGIYLLLSTQRPQKLHPNVLSQCDNLVLMRMNSAADLDHLASVFSFVPASLLARSAYFRQGETLLAGKFAPSPLFAQFGGRISEEGGSDVPTTWAQPR